MERSHPNHEWARNEIAESAREGKAVTSAVTVAELCSYSRRTASEVSFQIRSTNVKMVDVPVLAAEICGMAYRRYLDVRKSESGKEGPKTPLADFFIGAHAELMGWDLVTGDEGRFKTYFPSVKRVVPFY